MLIDIELETAVAEALRRKMIKRGWLDPRYTIDDDEFCEALNANLLQIIREAPKKS